MNLDFSYEFLSQKNQWILFSKTQADTLHMRIQQNYQIGQQIHQDKLVYYACVQELSQFQKLSQFCHSVASLVTYLTSPQNYQVDANSNVIRILAKNMFNNHEMVELASIPIIKTSYQKCTVQQLVKNIHKICDNRLELKNYEIRNSILLLTQCVSSLILGHNSKQCKNQETKTYYEAKRGHQVAKPSQLQPQAKEDRKQGKQQKIIKQQQMQSTWKDQIKYDIQILRQNMHKEIKKYWGKLQAKFADFQYRINEKIDQFKLTIKKLSHQKPKETDSKPSPHTKRQMKSQEPYINIEEKTDSIYLYSKEDESLPVAIKPVLSILWVDTTCFYNSWIALVKNNITNQKNGYVYVFGNEKIKHDRNFIFRINRMKSYIGLGIADSQYRKGNFGPNIVYFTSKGKSFIQGKEQQQHSNGGIGFSQKQIVEMVVQFDSKQILWQVKGVNRHIAKFQKIASQNIEWVPYICMRAQGDSVSVYQ